MYVMTSVLSESPIDAIVGRSTRESRPKPPKKGVDSFRRIVSKTALQASNYRWIDSLLDGFKMTTISGSGLGLAKPMKIKDVIDARPTTPHSSEITAANLNWKLLEGKKHN